MQIKQLTYLLVTLAALFLALSVILNLWFYAAAGFVLPLYLAWRFFAFQAAIATLHLDIQRRADKTTVRRGGHVTVEVSVSSASPAEGRFIDVLPNDVELVDGTNSAYLTLRSGETSTWRYTLVPASREAVQLGRADFTLDNGWFAHTIHFTTDACEVAQPPYAISVESGAGGHGGAPGVASTSVESLYRARRTGAGFQFSHLRPYTAGDRLRDIHWKASARLDQLVTKQFFAELENIAGAGTSISLIVDQSGTMTAGPPGATELDFAVDVMGRFIESAIAKGNQIGLVTYDDHGVTTSLRTGSSLPHVSSVVRSLNEIAPSAPLRRPRRKLDVTGSDVVRIKKHFEDTRDEEIDDDERHFRHVISYLYAHEEGYMRSLQRSPAFRAIASSLKGSRGPSTVVLVSDLENEFSPLSEGIRLAALRAKKVCVIALFSKVFQQFDDPLLAIEDVYAAYDAHRRRIQKLEHIHNVKVIDANAAETLQPVLKEARIG